MKVNGRMYSLDLDPDTPLLYALSEDLALNGPKFANRRVSTTLRHSGVEFREYFGLSFGVC